MGGGVTHLPIFFDVFKLKMRETASGPDFGCVGAWWKSLKSLFPRKEPRNGKMATIYSGGSTFCGRVPSTESLTTVLRTVLAVTPWQPCLVFV